MGPENAATFAVNKLKHPDCNLVSGFGTTYRVMKMRARVHAGRSSLQFFAIHGTANFTKYQGLGAYIGQVAVANCRSGHIDLVNVGTTINQDARMCGIATVLTELCLLDPEIHERGERNAAYKMLQRNQLELNCIQMVSLQMIAKPLTGANAYFSAAINTGFNKLVVFPRFSGTYNIYDTEIAKQNYDGKTGFIEICCQNKDRCYASGADWIFCKEM